MEKFRRESLREAREKANKRNIDRWAAMLAVSSALHVGGVFHQELIQKAGDAPRSIRAAMDSTEQKRKMNELLGEVGAKLEKDEVLDIDLSEFHFEQERLSGGVKVDRIKEAEERYNAILEEAEEIKEDGEFDDVMGYVLEAQGEYIEKESFMSDLLIEGEGNCEAREKYISSALQDLYPEKVAAGEVQIQVFGAYTDAETGETRPGHVRVILDEGTGEIGILEGGSVQYVDASEQVNIPTYEVTQLAVKSALAAEGMYSFTDEEILTEEEMDTENGADNLSMERFRKPDTLEKLTLIGGNSIAAYPESTAVFNASPLPSNEAGTLITGSAGSVERQWDPAFEVHLVKEMDPRNPREIVQRKPNRVEYPLYLYTNGDADAAHEAAKDAGDLWRESPGPYSIYLQVAGDVPLSPDTLHLVRVSDSLNLDIMEPFHAEAWQEEWTPSANFRSLTGIPEGIETVRWDKSADVTLNFISEGEGLDLGSITGRQSNGELKENEGSVRHPILSTDVQTLRFEMNDYTRRGDEFFPMKSSPGTFGNVAPERLEFIHVVPTTLAFADLEQVEIRAPQDALFAGYFYAAKIDHLSLNITDTQSVQRKVLYTSHFSNDFWRMAEGTELPGGEDMADIGSFTLHADIVDEGAFHGAKIDDLDLHVRRLESGAIKNAEINLLTMSAHVDNLANAFGNWPTEIDNITLNYSLHATVSERQKTEIRAFCGQYANRGGTCQFTLSGQNAPREQLTIKDMEARWAMEDETQGSGRQKPPEIGFK